MIASAIIICFKTTFTQNLYTLNLSDVSNFSVTCGITTAVHWLVASNTCQLTTAAVKLPASPANQSITAYFTIESQNLANVDSAVIKYSVNGVWTTKSIIYGATGNNTDYYAFSLNLQANDTVSLKIIFIDSAPSDHWKISNGNISIGQPVPLPIELIGFSGKKENNKVVLKWETGTETNNNFFTIERSSDGKTFNKPANIPGAGNSEVTIDYSYEDAKPLNGTNYYILMQTDFDGTQRKYGDMIAVAFSFRGESTFSVYPNPAAGDNKFYVSANCNEKQEMLIRVYDNFGKTLYSKMVTVPSYGKLLEAIDLQNRLAPGVYIVTGASSGKYFKQRLLIN